ncbi:MAG: energy-coupling factor transporter ATPase [Clostridiales bacterium]|nr:energy-coupling factor transporter ATPase [Clostridiales bacterium]
MNGIISTRKINFAYTHISDEGTGKEKVPVLTDVSLDISEGEFVAVLGHNGSGKSTLAKHFNAILLPGGGKVYVDGIDTAIEDRLFDIRQRVGMVFQNPDNQLVATIVEEDVAFALENLGVEPTQIRERVDEALRAVNMYEYREHSPHQLSGGQKQRIAVAGVIAMRPKCIVLDEPTAMLDPRGRKEVINTVRELNEKYGITIVLITHYMDEAARADRVVVMDKGRIILDDVPKKVFSQVELLKSVGLDVPQVSELIFELSKEGIELPTDIITEQECVDALLELLQSK